MDEFICSCCGDPVHVDAAAYSVDEDVFFDPNAAYVDPAYADLAYVDPYASDVYLDPGWVDPAYVEEFYVEPVDGTQPYSEPAYVEETYVESVYTEPVQIEPAANVATIGGFDLNGGITVVEPAPVVPDSIAPTGNEITIGGFDLNGGITVVEPTYAQPAWIPQVGNVATVGGFDINGGITVADSGAAPLPANQVSIGGPPLPEFDVTAIAWGQDTWDLVLSAGRNVQTDPFAERVVGDTIAMTAIRSIDVTSSNAMFNNVNWGPSSGTSYNYEHRLQNNSYGTSY